jgi:predicted Co/Zn/Cd cation transporter (cation efflux family)
MTFLFDALWIGSGLVFLVLAASGFFVENRPGRFYTGVGLLSATMLLAAQGLIVLVGVFWMLPAGFYPGLKDLVSGRLGTEEFPPAWIFTLIWAGYVVALLAYVFLRHRPASRIIWLFFVVACLLNVAGCQRMISSLRNIH